MPTQDELKKQVGYKAVDDYVRSGMKIGLGTGSTAYFAVERVGELLASGKLQDIVAVRTSPSAAAPRRIAHARMRFGACVPSWQLGHSLPGATTEPFAIARPCFPPRCTC